MLEAKDPSITLFGKRIPVGSGDSAGAPASSSGDVVDECVDQNHASSTNSSRESHTNRDAQEEEIEKVWGFWGSKVFDFDCDPLF